MDTGFFPTEPPKAEGARYLDGARVVNECWPPEEDLVLIPALASCRHPEAYTRACERLGELFGRRPRPGSKQRSTPEFTARRMVALIKMRTQTRLIAESAPDAYLDLARAVYRGERSGPVVRWGEGEILGEWAGKLDGTGSPNRNRGRWADLMTILDRRPDDRDAEEFVRAGCPMPGAVKCREAFGDSRAASAVSRIRLWTRASAVWRADHPVVRALWSALLNWLFAGD